jgi:hypothetical protein
MNLCADLEVRVWGFFSFFFNICSQTLLHSAMFNDSVASSTLAPKGQSQKSSFATPSSATKSTLPLNFNKECRENPFLNWRETLHPSVIASD